MSTLVQNCLQEFIFSSKLNFFFDAFTVDSLPIQNYVDMSKLFLKLHISGTIGLKVIHGTPAQIRIEIIEIYKKKIC
jgi:hypothetical protein